MRTLVVGLLSLVALASCGPSFEPPKQPPHDEEEGGALHAARYEHPFECGTASDPEDKRGVPCPDVRPPDAQLSCDATGCHGGLDFSEPPSVALRHLFGSEGPSCYTCHGEKWKDD